MTAKSNAEFVGTQWKATGQTPIERLTKRIEVAKNNHLPIVISAFAPLLARTIESAHLNDKSDDMSKYSILFIDCAMAGLAQSGRISTNTALQLLALISFTTHRTVMLQHLAAAELYLDDTQNDNNESASITDQFVMQTAIISSLIALHFNAPERALGHFGSLRKNHSVDCWPIDKNIVDALAALIRHDAHAADKAIDARRASRPKMDLDWLLEALLNIRSLAYFTVMPQ